MDRKIDQINKVKKESSDNNLESLNSVLDVFDPSREKRTETQIYNEVKASANKIAKYLKK
jgi:hypothetical protein